jgi:FtsP/CotA-like multicopper oxidase with cupredoxin domain
MRIAAVLSSSLVLLGPVLAQQAVVIDVPEVSSPFTLTAAYDENQAHNAFFFQGNAVSPTIRVPPGGAIKLQYANNLPAHSTEKCALATCADKTNLHFHGLHVSPDSPQDDVLTMMAMPGEKLNYRLEIPPYAAPGLYWYHTHPHGESARQDLDGMSGAIVIDGIDRYYPALRGMRERVLVLRDRDLEDDKPEVRHRLLQRLDVPPGHCGTSTEQEPPERILIG